MTVKNKYPLPLISKLVFQLCRARYFTKLDVHWGFNNVRIKPGDEWKAAFRTNRGLFKKMETMRKEVKTAMERTKETMKRQYDKRTSIARGKEHSNKLTLKEARPEMIPEFGTTLLPSIPN